ncbi:MAG: FG-GAP repeat protein [Microbulbifer sp.]
MHQEQVQDERLIGIDGGNSETDSVAYFLSQHAANDDRYLHLGNKQPKKGLSAMRCSISRMAVILAQTLCKAILALTIAFGLSACGGGGGGDNSSGSSSSSSSSGGEPRVSYAFTSAQITPGGDLANPKTLKFTWNTESNPDSFRLEVNPDGSSGFISVVDDISGSATSVPVELESLHFTQWSSARYQLVAVKDGEDVSISDALPISNIDNARLVGYFKAPVMKAGNWFGSVITLSPDGETLAVSAANTSFVDESGNSVAGAGTVYLYEKREGGWVQTEQFWASFPTREARFGSSVVISADGNTMAIGAPLESYTPDQEETGAVYFYVRSENGWQPDGKFVSATPTAYARLGTALSLSADGMVLAAGAPTPLLPEGVPGDGYAVVYDRLNELETILTADDSETGDRFGTSLSVSSDGKTVVVGAPYKSVSDEILGVGTVYIFLHGGEEGSWGQVKKYAGVEPWGIYGSPVVLSADGGTLAIGVVRAEDELGEFSSGVFVYKADKDDTGARMWPKPENYQYISAPGSSISPALALSADGSVLVVSRDEAHGSGTGIGSEHNSESRYSGAVDVYRNNELPVYVKASNPESYDLFGIGVSISADGNTLAVGAPGESSCGLGVGGEEKQDDNGCKNSGAVYLY